MKRQVGSEDRERKKCSSRIRIYLREKRERQSEAKVYNFTRCVERRINTDTRASRDVGGGGGGGILLFVCNSIL